MSLGRAKWLAALMFSLLGAMAQAVTINAFVEEASQQIAFQTESARVALEKSQTPEIRDFANKTITQNTQLYERLKDLGNRLRMDVPTEGSLSGKAKLMRLESRDDSFDRIYVASQAETLEQRVFLFKKEAMSSENRELKKFANDELPELLKQEQTVKALQEKLKTSAGKLSPPNNLKNNQ